jgi:hypothetical protein
MAMFGRPAEDVGLGTLMAGSPESRAHMSVAAEASFLLGLAAVLSAGFSVLFAVTLAVAAAALGCGVVGMITTRDPETAGSALSAVGLFAGLLAAALVGLRYLGLDTAYADDFGPWVWDQLQRLNASLPQPG